MFTRFHLVVLYIILLNSTKFLLLVDLQKTPPQYFLKKSLDNQLIIKALSKSSSYFQTFQPSTPLSIPHKKSLHETSSYRLFQANNNYSINRFNNTFNSSGIAHCIIMQARNARRFQLF